MLWEEYYDKLSDWATSTAVSRMSKLESFGPPDEIIDAINQISFDDEKGAGRLLKKAIAAGVKFSGDQLAEISLICDENLLNQAIRFSSDEFTANDLEALYCNCSDDILIEISRKHKIALPEDLAEYMEPNAFQPKANHNPNRNKYIYCPNCGKYTNSNFCPDCGRDLRNLPVKKAPAVTATQTKVTKDIYLVNTKITPAQFDEMMYLLKTGDRLTAIRKIREWTPLSLADAVHIADSYRFLDFHHPQTSIHVYREDPGMFDSPTSSTQKKTQRTGRSLGKGIALVVFSFVYLFFYIIAQLVKPYMGKRK